MRLFILGLILLVIASLLITSIARNKEGIQEQQISKDQKTNLGSDIETLNWRIITTTRWQLKVPQEWHFIDCGNLLWVGLNIKKDLTLDQCYGPYDSNLIINWQTKRELPELPYSDHPFPLEVRDKELTIDGKRAIDRQVYSRGEPLDRQIFIEDSNGTHRILFRQVDDKLKSQILDSIDVK